MGSDLWLNEAMLEFNKKFHKGVLNIINAPAGSGKSTFIFKEFLDDSYKYVESLKNTKRSYKANLDKVLYVCDTNMLKSSILQENQGITKILEKDDLKEAKDDKTFEQILNNDIGHIKVITYSTLGWLLKQTGARYILLKYFQVIIMDEMHNLFKYANRFDSEENGKPYSTVIDYLLDMMSCNLIVALSATTGRIYNGLKEKGINTNTVFTYDELKNIRRLKEQHVCECKYLMNEIKRMGIYKDHFDKHQYKAFIYTNTVRMSEKYKQQLAKYGYKAEWLCSINNTTVNEEGEVIPIMNEYQLEIRDKLIQTGMLPDDLDVIIVNSGYETGWNLKDERVQYVYIDSTDSDTQIQARNRIRHDIVQMVFTAIVDSEGIVYEYDQFRQLQWKNYTICERFIRFTLDEKYIDVKLSKEDKEYLVDRYAIIHLDKKEANWKTFKTDLEHNDYIVDNAHKGTFIHIKEEFEQIKSNKKGVKSVNEIFIKWLEQEWDKKRITCQDIMDMLDIGRKSFNKLIEDSEIIQYFKEHRYKIGNIKGSKTNYLMKY